MVQLKITKGATEEDKKVFEKFMTGEWVDSEAIQKALGLTFAECFRMFDFARTAVWWSIAGKTAEERARNGQKIVTQFRLKPEQMQKHI